jgi:hypothetical protein
MFLTHIIALYIQRILGIEEPSAVRPKTKKRAADEMGDDDGSDEEDEEADEPPVKKIKVDRYVDCKVAISIPRFSIV